MPTRPRRRRSDPLPVIGWREWVRLPELSDIVTKVKVDTGARSSALHAFGLKRFERDGEEWARFDLHPPGLDRHRALGGVRPIRRHLPLRI